MKKLITIIFLLLTIIPFKVSALDNTYNNHPGCTYSEISALKKAVSLVRFSYDYNKDTLTTITLSNIKKEFYAKDSLGGTYIYNDTNQGILSNNRYYDDQTIKVIFYASNGNCSNELLLEKNYKLPKYNIHFNDPICNGIDPKNLAICGKWYPSDVSYDDFKIAVDNYKKSLIKDEEPTKEEPTNTIDLVEILMDYYIYGIAFFTTLLIVLIIIMRRNKKKRSII